MWTPRFARPDATLPLLLCAAACVALAGCGDTNGTTDSAVIGEVDEGASSGYFNPTAYAVPYDVVLPADTTDQSATLTALASFAWREFIALNYPSSYTTATPTRGEPDTGTTPIQFAQGGAAPRVWQSYMHRVEIFPDGATAATYPTSYDTPPRYRYPGANNGDPIPACGAYDASTGTWPTLPVSATNPALSDLQLFNNLDETTQIDLATMFVDGDPNAPGTAAPSGTPLYYNLPGQPRRFIYQAKANRVMADYIRTNGLYDADTRAQWKADTYTAVRQNGQGGVAPCPPGSIICFPPGQLAGQGTEGTEGTIEVKATWRQLTATEAASGRYLTGEVIRYRNPDPANATSFCYEAIPDSTTATSLPYGLVGLHIIHKTVNVPTFVFATFEQVDNLDQSQPHNQLFYYNRDGGVVNSNRQDVNARAHPIPDEVEAVNREVQSQLSQLLAANDVDDSVWRYYKLVGVQGPASDYVASDDYYLANITTETNETLRSFTGALNANGTTDPTAQNVYRGTEHFIGGGCKGCHGNAQVGPAPATLAPGQQGAASDFSFITLNAPFNGRPDAVNQPLLKADG